MFSQKAVTEAIEEIIKEMRLDEEKEAFRLECKELGKVRLLLFFGDPGIAEQRARKFVQLHGVAHRLTRSARC